MYCDVSVNDFMRELASGAPTPGGGSAAALSGALGAALVSMVCNLTIGKPKYAAVEELMQVSLAKADTLRCKLLSSVDADIAAYSSLIDALKLPRATEQEKEVRRIAVQEGLIASTRAPLEIARLCREVLDLCLPIAEQGNVNAVSDAAVAAVQAEAGLRSAAFNVDINLMSMKDRQFASSVSATLNRYLEGASEAREQVVQVAAGKM